MTQRSAFFPLSGGLDQVTQAIAVPQGRCIAAKNHESVALGYGRVAGYERFDGRTGPTEAAEDFEAVDDRVGARAARDAARALIQQVPGSGPVTGVYRFKGTTYAWRDAATGDAAHMYRSTQNGWSLVDIGRKMPFTSGGTHVLVPGETVTGATSNATGIIRKVVVTSGGWATDDAVGYLIVDTVTGTFVAENIKAGPSSNAATITGQPPARAWPAGGRYSFLTYNFYATADTTAFYGVNGVGQPFAFDGGAVDFITPGTGAGFPTRIAQYKKRLWFAFPGGRYQSSATGEPFDFSGVNGAVEGGVGDDITDFISNNTNSLTMLARSSIHVLTGNDETDFMLDTLTEEAGALPYTAQRIGVAMYLDNRGLRQMTATQAYGNFKLGTLTPQMQPTLDRKQAVGVVPVASVTVRGKDQYRLYWSDGTGLSVYMGRKFPEPMPFDLGVVVSCICSSEEDDGRERIFFGAANGFVYEAEVGTSADGELIEAYLQLPYNHEGAPRLLKRWHKVIIEMVAQPETRIGIVPEFDYASGEQLPAPLLMFDVHGGGGLWNIDEWNRFQWSAPSEGEAEAYLDGQGRNMALTIASNADDQRPYVLQGVTLTYSVRGQLR